MRLLLLSAVCVILNAGAAELRRENVQMPGDEAFGFFSKPGYCRIRTKLLCNFVAFGSEARDRIVNIKIQTKVLQHRSDEAGIFDVKFKCAKKLLNETVRLKVANFETNFTLKQVPKEIKIPENLCNSEIPF